MSNIEKKSTENERRKGSAAAASSSKTADESSRVETPRPPHRWFTIRRDISPIHAVLMALLCIALFVGVWWYVTTGHPLVWHLLTGKDSERIFSKLDLTSPVETFQQFHSLWFERALTRNAIATLRRVSLGFALAMIAGVPIGILAGCFPSIRAFFTPLVLFGRNIPIAALIPLTFILFGIDETQKVIFIFIACVAFIISDTATAMMDVGQAYIDTAYTLGAKRRHVIMRVLFPLALPSVFDSARLLFGLAFGYIMLAETIKSGDEEGGLGNLISVSQRSGSKAHIYLIILIIPVLAFAIDRLLYLMQKELFPHRYGGLGLLQKLTRRIGHSWGDFKSLFIKPKPPFDNLALLTVNESSAESLSAANRANDQSTTQWRP